MLVVGDRDVIKAEALSDSSEDEDLRILSQGAACLQLLDGLLELLESRLPLRLAGCVSLLGSLHATPAAILNVANERQQLLQQWLIARRCLQTLKRGFSVKRLTFLLTLPRRMEDAFVSSSADSSKHALL